MITLLFIYSVLSSVLYWWYIKKSVGIQDSISKSFYALPKNKRWMFVVFIFNISFPLILIAASMSIAWYVGAAMLLVFVGFAAAFRDPVTLGAHLIGSYGAIIIGYVGMAFLGDYYLPVLFGAFSAYAFFGQIKNHTWWIESAAIIGVYLDIAFRLIY